MAILRRCVDCNNFVRGRFFCRRLESDMSARQAEEPGLLSPSTNCRFYQPASRIVVTPPA